MRLTAAANEQIGFSHPDISGWNYISLTKGERLRARSIINSEFLGRVEEETSIGGKPAIVPSVTGRAWITGTNQLMLDPEDSWPDGYRVSDIWPGAAS